MGVFSWIGGGLRALGGTILPVFARSRDARRLKPAVWWALHILMLSAVLVGLWLLNRWLDLGKLLVTPHPVLRDLWLPSLFLLVYSLSWLGWWLWNQLGPEQESPVFADIDQAWNEAVRALDQASIDLTEAPLFLVLGRPRGTEEALFQGAQLRLQISGVPRRADAPLRVYASRDAVYVTCTGVSLLSRQSDLMAEQVGMPETADVPVVAALKPEFATMTVHGGSESAVAIEQIIARARESGRGLAQLGEEEKRALSVLMAEQNATGDVVEPVRAHVSVLRNRADAELMTERLRHVGRLIARDRKPFCPLNGVLLLIPLAATRGDEEASQVGLICHRDLATVRAATHVRCPVFALVCELETLPGFREMIARLPEGQRDRRMGQRFPLVPDLEPSKVASMLESGIVWIGRILFPNLVDRLWAVESLGQATTAEAVRGNVRLYELMRQVRDRMSRLARLLIRASAGEGNRPDMFGGCYLAGTGMDTAREQAFIPGVFRRLTECQDFVAWTPDAVREDAAFRSWAQYGYIALTVVTLACAALAVVLLRR
jgi:hypothetical protein